MAARDKGSLGTHLYLELGYFSRVEATGARTVQVTPPSKMMSGL